MLNIQGRNEVPIPLEQAAAVINGWLPRIIDPLYELDIPKLRSKLRWQKDSIIITKKDGVPYWKDEGYNGRRKIEISAHQYHGALPSLNLHTIQHFLMPVGGVIRREDRVGLVLSEGEKKNLQVITIRGNRFLPHEGNVGTVESWHMTIGIQDDNTPCIIDRGGISQLNEGHLTPVKGQFMPVQLTDPSATPALYLIETQVHPSGKRPDILKAEAPNTLWYLGREEFTGMKKVIKNLQPVHITQRVLDHILELVQESVLNAVRVVKEEVYV